MAEGINKANFFVVGAAKAGTTSVYSYLEQHSDAFMSSIKEPNYFSSDINTDEFSNTYKKNTFLNNEAYFSKQELEPLHLGFVRNEEHYNRLFEQSTNQKILCECSTSYLYSKVAAQNIYNYNPEAKILIILREPVSRTFSHYLMGLRFGYTTKGLIDSVNEDIARDKKGWGASELFLELSLYYEQVKRYQDIFPEGQIKIMFFEDLKKAQLAFMNELCGFLNITPFKELQTGAKNEAQLPKNIKLNKFLTDTGIKRALKAILPGKLKDKARSAYVQKSDIPKLTNEEREFLNQHLEENKQQLMEILPTAAPWK